MKTSGMFRTKTRKFWSFCILDLTRRVLQEMPCVNFFPREILKKTFIFMNVLYFFSVGVHVLVEDVNEFAPKWKIHSENKEESASDHTLATNVAIEEGQLLEEVTHHI